MAIIKKIGILSAAKIQGIFGFIMGILAGLTYAYVGMLMVGTTGLKSIMFSPLAIVIAPIMYGIGGFIFGALAAWIYNMCAKWIGGLEIELK